MTAELVEGLEGFTEAGDQIAEIFDDLMKKQMNFDKAPHGQRVDAIQPTTDLDASSLEASFTGVLSTVHASGLMAAELNLMTTVVTNASSAVRRLQSGN